MSDEATGRGQRLGEIAAAFLKIGATAYGGPAIMGVMQAELQERRGWVTKARFVEGMALVNMLPGAAATQLGIFLGRERGGWLGGLVAGICFVLPAFAIMLALTLAYAAYGTLPAMKGALYGLGPVVLGIFLVAVYRLGRNAVTGAVPLAFAGLAAALAAFSPLGVAAILALAGAGGVALFHSRRAGGLALAAMLALGAAVFAAPWPEPALLSSASPAASGGAAPGLAGVGSFFLTVGAFSFGGGLTLIAFIQEHVVNQYQWLTQREFIDGLALGQFTPGPILMVSAYVGYKLAGLAGAALAAGAIFLPAFVLMLGLAPVLDRVRALAWAKAALRGIGPAVIGVLAVSLVQMAPHAVPDALAGVLFAGTVAALLAWKIGAVRLLVAGALVGWLRDRIAAGLRVAAS